MLDLVNQTDQLLERMPLDNWLAMREMDKPTQFTLKLYSLMSWTAFWHRPELLTFLACRMIHLSLEQGVCPTSAECLVQYSLILCNRDSSNIAQAYDVARIGMALLKKFDLPALIPRIYFCELS